MKIFGRAFYYRKQPVDLSLAIGKDILGQSYLATGKVDPRFEKYLMPESSGMFRTTRREHITMYSFHTRRCVRMFSIVRVRAAEKKRDDVFQAWMSGTPSERIHRQRKLLNR